MARDISCITGETLFYKHLIRGLPWQVLKRLIMEKPMSSPRATKTTNWTGYYAVRVQIDVDEYALDGQITQGSEGNPRLFASKEEAEEQAKKWNTGVVIQYMGKV